MRAEAKIRIFLRTDLQAHSVAMDQKGVEIWAE